MEHGEMNNLLKRYLEGKCTPEERLMVEQWYTQLDISSEGVSKIQMEEDISEIRNGLPSPPIRRMNVCYRLAAAIAIFAIVSTGLYFYVTRATWLTPKSGIAASSIQQDLVPGKNRAILKLANGTEIMLNEKPNGEIAHQGEQAIYKNVDGELAYRYKDNEEISKSEPVFNSLKTPRGGQYHLILPDGTKVWLNAASTLTYAISRSLKERLVKLEGEAYFEVARDPDRPFRVESRGQMVEVLGTHFNINSYPDEPNIKTTLLEGLVKVKTNTSQQELRLKPGQQATLDSENRLSLNQVDPADAMAWKNGKFSFNQSDIGTVARQLSRWYDVEVVFKGKASNITLSGEVYRNTNASKVLEILSYYKLDCQIETSDGVKHIIIQ